MNYCGFDFGTSNSTVGVCLKDTITNVPLEDGREVLRSAIFFDDHDEAITFGSEAIENYILGLDGRLMVSLKSLLGSSLMEEKTLVFEKKLIEYSTIIGYLIKHMKMIAEDFNGEELESVVLGRPVHFNDTDQELDNLAQDTLADIAKKQGFKNIEFQYEPVAAAMAFGQDCIREELAFIADIGGGTSDFAIIKLNPNHHYSASNVLASSGIHIGGTDFDRIISYNRVTPLLGNGTLMRAANGSLIQLPTSYYHTLSQWHMVNRLYNGTTMAQIKDTMSSAIDRVKISRLMRVLKNKQGHHIIDSVERAKIEMTEADEVLINFGYIENDLSVVLNTLEFDSMVVKEMNSIRRTILSMLKDAQICSDNISVVYFTGGSSKLESVRRTVSEIFINAKVVDGDTFNSVGRGLTIDAARRFG